MLVGLNAPSIADGLSNTDDGFVSHSPLIVGLRNVGSSCWMNTCLQIVFSLPSVLRRLRAPCTHANSDLKNCLRCALRSLYFCMQTQIEEEIIKELTDLINVLWRAESEDGKKTKLFIPNGNNDAHECLLYLIQRCPDLFEELWGQYRFFAKCGCGKESEGSVTRESVIFVPVAATLHLALSQRFRTEPLSHDNSYGRVNFSSILQPVLWPWL